MLYGSHSQKGWDIEVKGADCHRKIQVKTVSAYSKTRTISPIHKGWDVLHLLYLDKAFKPLGFWVITDTNIFGKQVVLKSKRCALPGKINTGSKCIPFGDNKVSELLKAIGE